MTTEHLSVELTKAELTKRESGYLRGKLAADVEAGGDAFVGDSPMLLKFHGIYQQDDRDLRKVRTQARLGPAHSCMVRASVPGGVISRERRPTRAAAVPLRATAPKPARAGTRSPGHR